MEERKLHAALKITGNGPQEIELVMSVAALPEFGVEVVEVAGGVWGAGVDDECVALLVGEGARFTIDVAQDQFGILLQGW